MWTKKIPFSFFVVALVILSCTLTHPANANDLTVAGSPGPEIIHTEGIEQVLKSGEDATTFPAVTLEPVAAVKLRTYAEQESIPKQIGFNRNVSMLSTAQNTGKQLIWQELLENRHYTGIEISSPQAVALRVGITVENLPEDAEFRFFRAQRGAPADIQLVFGREILDILKVNKNADPTDSNGEIFWSPTVAGDTIGIEIYLPNSYDPSLVQIAFPLISHITSFSFDPTGLNYSFEGYGDANSCQNDATCAPLLLNMINSVAGVQFTTGVGTYVCTGSLLNDRDPHTWKPYFITANHCIDRQSVASTIETHWFWQSATCNGSTLSHLYRKVSGGATLLHTQAMSSGAPVSTSMDITLLELNNAPAAGAMFAGWTTAIPPGRGTSRVGIHHPKADWKKISYGTSAGDAACGWADGQEFRCIEGSGNFYIVHWIDGGTEPGSSGSAVYFNNDTLIGVLSGSTGSCAGSYSVYSSFRATYAAGNYGQWLNVIPSIAPINLLLLK
ncbi:MAG: trypsin-like serine protease [Deltaproteobacteria bacterium]|nr:trypsin-like serine protease [Deltaproteobacteria bacterium]